MRRDPNLQEKKRVAKLYLRRIEEHIEIIDTDHVLEKIMWEVKNIFSKITWGYY
jgi:hypothetical protein